MDIEFINVDNEIFGHFRDNQDTTPAELHYHNVYELYYFLHGTRNYLTHNKIYPLQSDWITLSKPYVIHGTNGETFARLLIWFSEDFLKTHFQPSLIETFHEVFSVDVISSDTISANPRIKELFYLIMHDYQNNDYKLAAIHLGELLLLLNDAIKKSPTSTNTSTLPSQMQEIMSYVSKNLSTIKNLEQVAKHFFISKYHLSHQFKAYTGFTFIEFLTKIKISHALHLLKFSDKSVAEISTACGFDTPAYFCIVFKKKMNMSPLHYRSLIKQKKHLTDEKTKK